MKTIVQTDHTQLSVLTSLGPDPWLGRGVTVLENVTLMAFPVVVLKANVYFVKIAKVGTVECWPLLMFTESTESRHRQTCVLVP